MFARVACVLVTVSALVGLCAAQGVQEVQVYTLVGATGGAYTLSVGARTTGPIPVEATAVEVATALAGLSNDPVTFSATVTRISIPEGFQYTVTFLSPVADVFPLVVDTRMLAGTPVVEVMEVIKGHPDEAPFGTSVVDVALTCSTGSFALVVRFVKGGYLNCDATAADVASSIHAIFSIFANTTVTKVVVGQTAHFRVTFPEGVRVPVTVDVTNLAGGTAVVTELPEAAPYCPRIVPTLRALTDGTLVSSYCPPTDPKLECLTGATPIVVTLNSYQTTYYPVRPAPGADALYTSSQGPYQVTHHFAFQCAQPPTQPPPI